MSLNKPCNICTLLSMGNTLFFRELIKNEDGKGTYHDRYICCHCKADLKKRLISTIKDSRPRALADNILHKIKESYI